MTNICLQYHGFFNGKEIEFNIYPESKLNDYQIRLYLKGKYGDNLRLSPDKPKMIVTAVI